MSRFDTILQDQLSRLVFFELFKFFLTCEGPLLGIQSVYDLLVGFWLFDINLSQYYKLASIFLICFVHDWG